MIRVARNGSLNIGKNFVVNKNSSISCCGNITIGEEVLLGWKVNIKNSDWHTFYD